MLNLNERIKDRLRNAVLWGVILLVTSFSAAILLLQFEQEVGNEGFANFGDLYWWWLETITGIGASSEPVSFVGRALATFIIIAGFVLLGLFISEFSAIVKMVYARKEEGNIRITYRGHIVIIGYSSLTAGIIKLLRSHYGHELKILLISNDISSNPFPGEVDFLHANPISSQTLSDANIAFATAAIIMANDRFRDPDSYTLVIAAEISIVNSHVITIAEVTNDENKDLFKKTEVDGFINRREMLADLLDNAPNPRLLRIINKQSNLEDRAEMAREAVESAKTGGTESANGTGQRGI